MRSVVVFEILGTDQFKVIFMESGVNLGEVIVDGNHQEFSENLAAVIVVWASNADRVGIDIQLEGVSV